MTKEIKPYAPEHLKMMDLDGPTRMAVGIYGTEKFSKIIYGNGPAMTGFVDGNPVCIAGITMMWDGVGEAWALMASGFEKHKFFIHRNVIRFMHKEIIINNIKRLQAAADIKHEKAIRWLEHLGFEVEGIMRKYFNGHDYLRFARII